MNKFNKGKLVGIVAASLSAVSLMGVGFATWVIGSQKTDTQGDVSITADSVQYKSLTVSVKFLDGITNDLTIIPVPSGVSKTKMTQTKGAILVDDYSGNLIDWEASGGIGIKFTKEKESNCKFKNITSLEEILDIFD